MGMMRPSLAQRPQRPRPRLAQSPQRPRPRRLKVASTPQLGVTVPQSQRVALLKAEALLQELALAPRRLGPPPPPTLLLTTTPPRATQRIFMGCVCWRGLHF
jgi:hypothetical protein